METLKKHPLAQIEKNLITGKYRVYIFKKGDGKIKGEMYLRSIDTDKYEYAVAYSKLMTHWDFNTVKEAEDAFQEYKKTDRDEPDNFELVKQIFE